MILFMFIIYLIVDIRFKVYIDGVSDLKFLYKVLFYFVFQFIANLLRPFHKFHLCLT